MKHINTFFSWSILLSFALLGPVSLPAGGPNQISNCKKNNSDKTESIVLTKICKVYSSPLANSFFLRDIEIGMPFKVLRIWKSTDGSSWLRVKVTSLDFLDDKLKPKRGWIKL